MIINSTKLRADYSKIAEICRETGEPVYITSNGEGDTVLLNVKVYENLIQRTKLAASILEAERNRLEGGLTYSLDDVGAELRKIIDAGKE